MFTKLQHQQQQHHKFQQPLHPHQRHFQVNRECQTSEEEESRSSGGRATPTTTTAAAALTPTTPATKKMKQTEENDGASIEVVRRPRGRPPGSKNRPKPPVIITREANVPVMSPFVLELPGGVDIVDSISRFSRRKNLGLCILTGSGTVADVTLRQPSTAASSSTVTFHGRFDILSISATFFTQTTSFPRPIPSGFTISLAGPQGQIVGGAVAGPLLSAGIVYVIAASFNNPSYHRLPIEEDVPNSVSGGGAEGQSPPIASAGGGSEEVGGGHPPASESSGMAIYSWHIPTDVIWAPTARQPPPHY
ncbi:PPC domain [Dillenia turbinata]|uniref:AT-hook motif nuclear-localized protein n=1 Tax=Dillenia turbinata TaxID=194707 RepID=A0AAN8W5G4_9MAGN